MKGDFEKLKDAITPIVKEISPHLFHPTDTDKREMIERGLISDMDDSLKKIAWAYLIEGCKVTITVEKEDLVVKEGE